MLNKLRKGKQAETNTKATDRLDYMKATVPAWQTPSANIARARSYTALMARFNGWVFASAQIIARACSAQPIKLYSLQPKNGAKSLFPTQSLNQHKSAFLRGGLESKPSTFVQRKAVQGDMVEVFEHPILELLDNPSPEMDGYTLAVQRFLNLQITGNAYLHPIISETLGIPVELWNMQSDMVAIVPDGEMDLVDYYQYGQHPNVVEFRKDEVLHEKQPNPSDPFYGRGWVSACIPAIDLLDSMDKYEQNVLDNQARPDWAIMVKEHLTDNQYERLMQQVERQLGGSNNRSRPFIFEGSTDAKPMNFSVNDLQFAQGEIRKVEVISAISGVPVTMLKANDPNLASAREGSLGFLRNTVRPYLTLDESFLNRQLLPLFGQYAGDLFLAYDDPVAEDRQMQSAIDASDASAGIRTRNEIRSARGLEPVDGGNELLVPAGTVPIDVAIEQARNPQPMFGAFATEPKEQKAESCPEGSHWMPADADHPEGWCMQDETHQTYSAQKADDCVSSKVSILMAEGYPEDQAVAIAYSMCGKKEEATETKHAKDCGCGKELVSCQKSLFESHRSLIGVKRAPVDTGNADYEKLLQQNAQFIDTFFDGLTSVFSDQINNFLDSGMSDSSLWNDNAVTRLEGYGKDFVKEVMTQSGQQELDRLVPDMELKFDYLDPNLANALDDYTSQLTTTLKEGTQNELDRRIATGVRNGLSTEDIRRNIQGLLEEEPDTGIIPIRARAEMIARTEVAMIHEEAKFQAWKESGVVTMKQWQVSAGACSSCQTLAVMQPNPIPLDEPFAVQGQQVGKIKVWRTMMTAPLHPNCRCGTIEILGDETEEEMAFIGN
tara:strand:+ start:8514 stop:11015 length:2502 start_codon:yes stop_codon:yes gene_type:complete